MKLVTRTRKVQTQRHTENIRRQNRVNRREMIGVEIKVGEGLKHQEVENLDKWRLDAGIRNYFVDLGALIMRRHEQHSEIVVSVAIQKLERILHHTLADKWDDLVLLLRYYQVNLIAVVEQYPHLDILADDNSGNSERYNAIRSVRKEGVKSLKAILGIAS